MKSADCDVEGAMAITSGRRLPPGDAPTSQSAFVAFYERELGPQVRRATLLVGSPEAGHDLVHDAFVEVYRRWGELREPGPYLGRAVLNRCRDHFRRAATTIRDSASDTTRAPGGPVRIGVACGSS